MPKFQIAPETEQASASALKSEGADLSGYAEAIDGLRQPANLTAGGKYSKWLRVELGAGETRKTESRRFTTAAKDLGIFTQTAHDANKPNTFWLRTRPAPKQRAKRNGKAKAE